jgi:hypothetical protein
VKTTYSPQPQRETSSSFFYPASAWIIILGFILVTVGCILVGAGKALNLIFPAGSLVVGIFLYLRYPILYFGFCWWMCFLTPLVRRLSDYRGGFTDPSPILLAQDIIFLIPLTTVLQNLPKTHRQGGLPYVFCLASLFYGLLVTISQGGSPLLLIKGGLEWITPVLFGFYLFINWRNYPLYRQNLQRCFVWGVLVMGIYGVFQYLVAPEWDKSWLINAEFITAGTPEPFGIRVWSTMNGPFIFGSTMMAGLLLLFNERGFLCIPASAVGYLSFLLSLVRTAWGGWLVGMLTMFFSLKSSLQIRLILIFSVMVICVLPLTEIEPFSQVISGRLDSLSNLDSDGSATARTETYDQLLVPALTNLFGYGIGNIPDLGRTLDSTILFMLFSFGWLGTILYASGWMLLTFELFSGSQSNIDPLLSTSRAVVSAGCFMLFFASVMTGATGIVLWGFLSLGVAGKKYYRYQISQQ